MSTTIQQEQARLTAAAAAILDQHPAASAKGDWTSIPASDRSELLRLWGARSDLEAEADRLSGDRTARIAFGSSKGPTPGGAGFARYVADAGFDLKTKPTVAFSGYNALVKASTFPAPSSLAPAPTGVVPLGADRRFIAPFLPTADAGDQTGVQEWTATGRTVTGNPIRAIDATSDKASLGVVIEASVEELAQVAVVIPSIPNALLAALPALYGFLNSEGLFQVQTALDSHILSQIDAATPPNGISGTTLIEQTRNAIASMRALGANPDILLVSPSDAVTLDLSTTGADSQFVFALRQTGSSSPLWGVEIVEAAAMAGRDPLLVDSQMLGQLSLGGMRFDADPYSGFRANLTDLRIETSALFHVRDAAGCYRIAAA